MPIDHWMMFGTFAEQKHFVYPSPETYKGAIINGNMAAYAPDGLGAFLLERTANLKYIIDPLTHAFQHDPSLISDKQDRTKRSVLALARAYGDPIAEFVGTRPILPRDFDDSELFETFVGQCLEFQYSKLATAMQNSEAIKYVASTQTLRPYALIAPYFYMTESTYKLWLPLCVRALKIAQQKYSGDKVFASIVISQGALLDDAIRDAITKAFADTKAPGFIIWVDNFDELTVGTVRLKKMLEFIRALRSGGGEVINLHGGYFSTIAAGTLGGSAFSGVCHGPEFGEFRPVVPVGGGIPIARYYVPQLHARIRYSDAARFLRRKGWLTDAQTFHANVCNCPACLETLNGQIANFVLFGQGNIRESRRRGTIVRIDYPTGETKLRCLRHYLQRKSIEYQFALRPGDRVLEDLERGRDELTDVVGLDGVAHLNNWIAAFEK